MYYGHGKVDQSTLDQNDLRRISVQLLPALEHIDSHNITRLYLDPGAIEVASCHLFHVVLRGIWTAIVIPPGTVMFDRCRRLAYMAPEMHTARSPVIGYDTQGPTSRPLA